MVVQFPIDNFISYHASQVLSQD